MRLASTHSRILSVVLPTRRWLLTLLAVVFLTSFGIAATEAKETCPWINDPTAAGFLGGDVTSTVTFAIKDKTAPNFYNVDKNDATCEFVHHQGSVVTTLRIEVDTMAGPASSFATYVARCGSQSNPVRAVGNEAVACELEGKKGRISEQIVSRVRGRAFTVRMTSTGGSPERELLRQKVRNVAEQVAGFLF
jgi:hypothetical protein